jgi:hypothetical protein
MMGPTTLTLTSFQQRQLAPLFAEIRAGNARGESSAIMAQILPDGMVLKRVSGKALVALMEALGVDPNREPQRSVRGH